MKRPLETDAGLNLRYYIFDWDDNVVHMPTRIWMEDVETGSPVPLSTADYARRRNDASLRHAENAFREFRDETGDFESDLAKAMAGETWKGPAFYAFKQAVTGGRLFAIVTARGHAAETMRRGIESFINKVLSDVEKKDMYDNLRKFNELASLTSCEGRLLQDYLRVCEFIGVSHPDFVKRTGLTAIEENKKAAIRMFVKDRVEFARKTYGSRVTAMSFGMSDDDRKNVAAVDAFMRDELSPEYAGIKFVVFDTGDRSGKVKRLKPHISDPDNFSLSQ